MANGTKPQISAFIGKYGSAQGDAKAYAAAMEIHMGSSYSVSGNESNQFLNYYFKKNNGSTSSTMRDSGSGGSSLGNAVRTISGVQNIAQGATSLSQTELFQAGDFGNYVAGIMDAAMKDGSLLDRGARLFDAVVIEPFNAAIKQVTFFTEKEIELRYKINSQLSMAGKMTLDFRNNIEEASVKMVDVGYGFDDVADTLISITKDTGTMSMLGADVMERNRFTIRAAIGDLSSVPGFIKNFSDIGVGAESSFKQIEKSFKGSMELGLLGRDVVTKIGSNLSKINQYGFQNGVDGLTRMVQKSVMFKVNMESVFGLADDLFDPDKAIDLAANLQAIGGAIGGFNDPLKMMYNATNNVEGIQDALIGAASSLATYNQEQGRFEITGVNLRRAKAMAEQFGMSMEDLTKISIKSSERQSAATALMSRGLSLDDKEKEFLTNISRMEGGKMVIDVSSISEEFGNVQQIALDEITSTQLEKLKEYQAQFKEMDTKDIAREQYTTTQNIALNVSALVAMGRLALGKQTGKLGRTLDDVFGKDLEKGIRAAKDELMGKSTDAEVKKAFSGKNIVQQTSNNVNPSAKPQQSVPVNNAPQQSQTNTTTQNNQPNKTEISLNVKSDPIMDEFQRYLVKRPEMIDAFLNSETSRDYTSQSTAYGT